MDLIEAAIYGVVQGFTEWLPISSTAHLRLLAVVSGWSDPGAAFTASIQLGTLLAVLVYFGRDFVRVFKGWIMGLTNADARSQPDFKMGNGILIGSIPIVVAGLLFKDSIENDWRSLTVIAFALIGMGIVLAIAERFGKCNRNESEIGVKEGLWVGLWQAIALIPGASRSGSTMAGAMIAGFERSTAARYSFLLSAPSVLAAAVYSLIRHREAFTGDLLAPLIVANIISFVVGLASIALMMRVLSKWGTTPFVVYRLALGVAILALLGAGIVPALDSSQATLAR